MNGPENQDVLSVSALTARICGLLERQFPLCWVQGEIASFMAASSGHWYFTLKDKTAQVKVVMFRSRAALIGFVPKVGDQINVRARVSVYEARGDLQLNAEHLTRAGAGDLFAQFEALKQRLQAQGLFAQERKRPIPQNVQSIGVVTSPTGAAIHDVLSTLRRLSPRTKVTVFPALVQGAESPASLLSALERANDFALQRRIDLLLLVRGGGSMEDLWAFNDESLAHAISRFAVPVISGVGHETDFTICDFVADLRAATPTAAASLAVVDQRAVFENLTRLAKSLQAHQAYKLERSWQQFDFFSRLLRSPQERLQVNKTALQSRAMSLIRGAKSHVTVRRFAFERLAQRLVIPQTSESLTYLNALQNRLQSAARSSAQARVAKLHSVQAQLDLVNPSAVLDRGYAIVTSQNGRALSSAKQLQQGQVVQIAFADGAVDASVLGSALK